MAKTKHTQAKQKQKSGSPAKQPVPNAKPVSNTNGQAKKQVSKKRGALLSTLLVIALLHGILGAFLAYYSLQTVYADQKTWVLIGLALASLANAVAAAAMWYWKKWGIYLYVAAAVAQAVIHLVLTGSLLVVFYDFIPVLILGYVINLQMKSNLFE
jgi:hypothetical protein